MQRIASETAARLDRRDVLLASGLTAGLAVAPFGVAAEEQKSEKKQIAVENLSTFQKKDQLAAALQRAEAALRAGLTKEDANVALRAVLLDAGTYDISSNTGGVNGSIVLDQELGRPENKDIKSYIGKLKAIKQKIDQNSKAAGQGEYSWADVLVLAAKVTAQKLWASVKIKQSGLQGDEAGVISSVYGADFPVKLGRVDATKPDPSGRVPKPDARVQDIQKFLSALNNPNKEAPSGLFAIFQAKPLFWERPAFLLWTAAQKDPEKEEQRWVAADPQYKDIKKDYDSSRKSVTRTNYEVDFVTFFTNLANTGANFNPSAYLKPIDSLVTRL
ncbi:hypothetical protein WJX73_009908 [Symbiochloris irregularis]|uniref:Plant heme peroxidase family profile domain-containing protein n=1 Tax=Symbiochloris irregularis TaxID=706552 RepID=A0AAW1PFZ0_9CHLO